MKQTMRCALLLSISLLGFALTQNVKAEEQGLEVSYQGVEQLSCWQEERMDTPTQTPVTISDDVAPSLDIYNGGRLTIVPGGGYTVVYPKPIDENADWDDDQVRTEPTNPHTWYQDPNDDFDNHSSEEGDTLPQEDAPLPVQVGPRIGTHWSQPSATVYLDPRLDEMMRGAYLTAMDQWNQTGAFTFSLIKDADAANIIASQHYQPASGAAGVTNSTYNPVNGLLSKAKIYLNTYWLMNKRFGYTPERIINTAAHELGHAIGLDHNEGDSVMQSAGSYLSIRDVDVNTVKAIYRKIS